MSKPSIAVVILTLNEELDLQRCIDSVSWADELLVVDSGSQDRTLEIAKKNGARILHRNVQPFMISDQRNYALNHGGLSSKWVLFVDADEVITQPLRYCLIEVLTAAPADVSAFQLTPKYMFMGRWLKHCQGYPSWHDRLVRRGQARFAGGVWEHFVTNGRVGRIYEPYLHYSVNKGISDWFAKHDRYSTFEAYDIIDTLGSGTSPAMISQRTLRKRRLRDLSARFWPLRPVVRFLLMYFIRRGFLDGLPGLLYCLMIACYEFMVVLKVLELRRRASGLPI